MKNGVMAAINQTIDYDTAEYVATEMGCKVEKEVTVTIEERIIDDHVDTADELETRAPVVVVMDTDRWAMRVRGIRCIIRTRCPYAR